MIQIRKAPERRFCPGGGLPTPDAGLLIGISGQAGDGARGCKMNMRIVHGDPKMTEGLLQRQERMASRWGFLEAERDACSVVTRQMVVVYLNEVARSLVPPGWFGRRCWDVFPVGEESCASRCAAVAAVSKDDDIAYCEETIYAGDGSPLRLGVAVIPLRVTPPADERAILLLRAKTPGMAEEVFRRELLERAAELRASCDERLQLPPPRRESRKSPAAESSSRPV
jgi:hypothetical protein